MKRSWVAFRKKVELEGCCRVCGKTSSVEAAHLIPRSQVAPGAGEDPRNCIPLCGGPSGGCHNDYDRANPKTGCTLDLLPYLSNEEQAYSVLLVGIARAYWRLGGRNIPGDPPSNVGRSVSETW